MIPDEEDPYRDPVLYDLEYEGLNEDVRYYSRLASMADGPVLELGCGTGRITIPMAEAGGTIHGLDASPAMLKGLERKLAHLRPEVAGRITFQVGNFLELAGPAQYPLVLLPFNAIHHCQTHQEVFRLFDGLRRVLRPGGTFAMDCYLPDPSLYKRKKGERYEERTFHDPRTNHVLTSWESGWYDDLAQVHHVQYIYQHPDGREEVVHLALRMFYPQELRALIDVAGWDIVHEARDFPGRPLVNGCLKWVLRLVPRDRPTS